MSTLAILRPRWTPTNLRVRGLDREALFDRDACRAVDALDGGRLDRWRQVTPARGEWDDLLNEASGLGLPPASSQLSEVLSELAACSDECLVWYPGVDVATIAMVQDEFAFAATLVADVAAGGIEPGLRFIRRAGP